MKVLIVPMAGTKTTSLFVFCKVGSRSESKAINGVSHFLEHLMFKGTKQRPSTLVISQELESLGAEFNAFTSKDYTGYYIKSPSKHFSQAADILSDMLFHSTFDTSEISRERQVIIQEIHMYEENPMMHIDNLFEQAAFKGSPLGMDIAGPTKVIASVKRSSLLAYKKIFYSPANMLCVVAGQISPNTRRVVQKVFSKEENTRKRFPKNAYARFIPRSILVQQKKTEQSQIAIGFKGFDHNHKDAATLELLNSIFGGSMSSRLFIQVRERLGMCYSIRSEVMSYEDIGLVTIYAGVSSKKLREAVKAIQKEVNRIKVEPVTKDELVRAKEYLKGKLIMQMEASEKVAQWYGQEQLFMKTIKTPEQRLREIDKVTIQDIRRVAQVIFKDSTWSAAGIGPFSLAQFRSLFGG
ncbi:MAG: pitrilysin family protein [Patescibacteria group bacterium]